MDPKNNLNFKLISLNVRGIRAFEKRKTVFNWLIIRMQIFASYKKHTAQLTLLISGGNNGPVKSFSHMVQTTAVVLPFSSPSL